MINRSRLAALTAILLLGAPASSPVSATGARTADLPGTAGSADVGKSLCHAWSSGPAALIPSELLGIRPLSDGWATFEIDPQVPASMQPLEATIPTPYGDIRVWLRDNRLKVEVPQGSTAKFRGKSYTSAVPLEVRL